MHEIGLKKKYLLLDTLLSSLAHMFYAKLLYSYVHQKKKHFSWVPNLLRTEIAVSFIKETSPLTAPLKFRCYLCP